MANLNVKKGDTVMVITGKDKGKTGEVLKVNPKSGRVVVSGVNEVMKHVKPRKAQDKGGIIKQEGTIDGSDIMIVCPACNEVVRVRHTVETVDGKTKKVRVCAKCGADLDAKKISAKKAAKKVAKKATKAKKDKDAK